MQKYCAMKVSSRSLKTFALANQDTSALWHSHLAGFLKILEAALVEKLPEKAIRMSSGLQ